MLKFFDRVLRGISQIVFQNHPVTGFLILLGLGIGHYPIAIGVLIGSIISTLTAVILKYPSSDLDKGLFGYNGALIGAAYVALLIPGPLMYLGLAFATSFSAVLTFRIGEKFKELDLPVMTLPFVLMGWVGAGILAKKTLVNSIYLDLQQISFAKVILKNLSQVFLAESALGGLIIGIGIGISSFWAILFALFGSVVASGLGLMLELEMDALGAGLYGFSAVLTSMALGCIFQAPSLFSSLLALIGILLSVLLQVVLNELLSLAGVPAFTASFLLATWGLLYARRFLPPKIATY